MFVFYRQLSDNGYVFTDSESTGRTPAPPPEFFQPIITKSLQSALQFYEYFNSFVFP